ncbi:MAG TPA: sugar transferase [Gaiellaceae bacterium]|nr:sugar transferase [Gaiellaceae bacterium]
MSATIFSDPAESTPPVEALESPLGYPRLLHLPRKGRGWLIRRALAASDVAGLFVALILSGLFAEGPGWLVDGGALTSALVLLACSPLWVVAAKARGLYDYDESQVCHSSVDDLAPLANILTLAVLVYLFAAHLFGIEQPNYGHALAFWVTSIVLLPLARAGARAASRRHPGYRQRTLIVGAGTIGRMLTRKFESHPESGIEIVGFVDTFPPPADAADSSIPVLGEPNDLLELVREHKIDRVVVAFPDERAPVMVNALRSLRESRVEIDVVPRLFDLIGPGAEIHTIEGMPLVGLSHLSLSRSSLLLKRAFDIAIAVPFLILCLPLFLVTAVAIKLDSRGPVFFRQTRIGHHGRPFRLVKFRTMVVDADSRKHEVAHLNRHLQPDGDPRMFKIENDPRVTRVGRVLRKNFIDELPQLLNVVNGTMSLIGPRPLIPAEASYVDDWGRRRLDLKPGMTGMWQVLGRSAIGFGEMVKLDYFYTTTWSVGHDMRLLLQTIPVMLRGEPPV